MGMRTPATKRLTEELTSVAASAACEQGALSQVPGPDLGAATAWAAATAAVAAAGNGLELRV